MFIRVLLPDPEDPMIATNSPCAISRAVVNNPRMILADEPTGNLDTATSYEIMNIFRDLNEQGKTIVMITHEEDIACHSKRIINLKDGEIIEDRSNSPI